MDPRTGTTDSTGNVESMEMSYEFLKNITDGFSVNRIIGSGTFGVVYESLMMEQKVPPKRCIRPSASNT